MGSALGQQAACASNAAHRSDGTADRAGCRAARHDPNLAAQSPARGLPDRGGAALRQRGTYVIALVSRAEGRRADGPVAFDLGPPSVTNATRTSRCEHGAIVWRKSIEEPLGVDAAHGRTVRLLRRRRPWKHAVEGRRHARSPKGVRQRPTRTLNRGQVLRVACDRPRKDRGCNEQDLTLSDRRGPWPAIPGLTTRAFASPPRAYRAS